MGVIPLKKKFITLISILMLLTNSSAYALYNTSEMQSMSVNSEVIGNIRYQTERDMYNVSPSGYGLVEIEFEYPAEVNETSWRIVVITGGSYQVFNEKNSPEDPIYGDKRIHKLKSIRTNTALHVIITSFNKLCTSNYTLRIKQTKESFSDTEHEFNNNSPNFCAGISSNTLYKANLYNQWDVDYYSFRLTDNTPVTVTLNPPTTGGSYRLDILCDELIAVSSSNINSENTTLTTDILPPGQYFVLVSAGDVYSNSDYSFILN